MIQRKQTLFLFQLIFCGIALLFISNQTITTSVGNTAIFLIPLRSNEIASSFFHYIAIAINMLALVLAFITIFLFKQRNLQIKLCYVLIFIWMILLGMLNFSSFVIPNETITAINKNYFCSLIGLFAIIAIFFAIKFIKKDIELLKSADRIR